jgi:hypothetical protein
MIRLLSANPQQGKRIRSNYSVFERRNYSAQFWLDNARTMGKQFRKVQRIINALERTAILFR